MCLYVSVFSIFSCLTNATLSTTALHCIKLRNIFQKTGCSFGVSRFLIVVGLERAAPVSTLVQKLRAGDQFLARGRDPTTGTK